MENQNAITVEPEIRKQRRDSTRPRNLSPKAGTSSCFLKIRPKPRAKKSSIRNKIEALTSDFKMNIFLKGYEEESSDSSPEETNWKARWKPKKWNFLARFYQW